MGASFPIVSGYWKGGQGRRALSFLATIPAPWLHAQQGPREAAKPLFKIIGQGIGQAARLSTVGSYMQPIPQQTNSCRYPLGWQGAALPCITQCQPGRLPILASEGRSFPHLSRQSLKDNDQNRLLRYRGSCARFKHGQQTLSKLQQVASSRAG